MLLYVGNDILYHGIFRRLCANGIFVSEHYAEQQAHMGDEGALRIGIGDAVFLLDFGKAAVNISRCGEVAVQIAYFLDVGAHIFGYEVARAFNEDTAVLFSVVVGFMYNALGNENYVTGGDFVGFIVYEITAFSTDHIVNFKAVIMIMMRVHHFAVGALGHSVKKDWGFVVF